MRHFDAEGRLRKRRSTSAAEYEVLVTPFASRDTAGLTLQVH